MELIADGISHYYGGRVVLEDVSFTIGEGEIVCLIGPSGCGKSTLLRMLGGLEAPDHGGVYSRGQPPAGCLNPLTYVFQDFALLPWRDVAGNIALALEGHQLDRAEKQARIDDVLARTAMANFCHTWPRQLSGGMKQRVAIARALAVSPAILLMDEPLSALDSQTKALLLEDFVRLWCEQPFSACYVTHNLHEAVRLGHKVIVMSRCPGRIRQVVTIEHPLDERLGDDPELRAIEESLWQMMYDEAREAAWSTE
ncbi:ABC transporter ATP-binding protein [Cardiobacteriaceae bacterium TAE3-ERU3]|nr:ABC transporter ATP-binding protein [Cardiobacteriaceae bacterium TAE3-ERU3]